MSLLRGIQSAKTNHEWRRRERRTAAPKFSGVKSAQIYADKFAEDQKGLFRKYL
jgi:hypothetical protein